MATPATYGWDMVVATRTSVLNRSLHAPSAPFVAVVPDAGANVTVTGNIGGWQIVRGGSGMLVQFSVPCAELALSDAGNSYNFTGGSFLVQGQLAFSAPGPDGQQALQLAAGPGARAPTCLAASFSDPAFSGFAVLAVSALQAWLDAQTGFPYTFAAITLAPTGGAVALAPVFASYAYADTADNDGVLALLCTASAGATNPARLLQEVDPDVLGAGSAAMLLGRELVSCLAQQTVSAIAWPRQPVFNAGVAEPVVVIISEVFDGK